VDFAEECRSLACERGREKKNKEKRCENFMDLPKVAMGSEKKEGENCTPKEIS